MDNSICEVDGLRGDFGFRAVSFALSISYHNGMGLI